MRKRYTGSHWSDESRLAPRSWLFMLGVAVAATLFVQVRIFLQHLGILVE